MGGEGERKASWRWWHLSWSCRTGGFEQAGDETGWQREGGTTGRGKSVNPGVDRAGDVQGTIRSLRTQAAAAGGGQATSGLREPTDPLQQQRGVKAAPAWGPRGGRSCPGKQLQGLALGREEAKWPWDTTPLSRQPRSCPAASSPTPAAALAPHPSPLVKPEP